MDDINNQEESTLMFIDLSKQLIEKGDLAHAERLLKGGLIRAEKKRDEAESAVRGLQAELAKLYELQSRLDENSQPNSDPSQGADGNQNES